MKSYSLKEGEYGGEEGGEENEVKNGEEPAILLQ